MRAAALVVLALLAACAGRERVALQPCSPVELASYSPADQLRAAQSLEALEADDPLRAMVEELGGIRARLRVLGACW